MMNNDEIIKNVLDDINPILERLHTYSVRLRKAHQKNLVSDIAWLAMIEEIQVPENIESSIKFSISQMHEAVDEITEATELLNGSAIELAKVCEKWTHEDTL